MAIQILTSICKYNSVNTFYIYTFWRCSIVSFNINCASFYFDTIIIRNFKFIKLKCFRTRTCNNINTFRKII